MSVLIRGGTATSAENMADRAGFDDFVVARSGALLRTAYLLTRDRHLAEDLVQTALAKAWFARRRTKGDPEPYVRRIMVNEFATGRRRKRTVPAAVDEEAQQAGARWPVAQLFGGRVRARGEERPHTAFLRGEVPPPRAGRDADGVGDLVARGGGDPLRDEQADHAAHGGGRCPARRPGHRDRHDHRSGRVRTGWPGAAPSGLRGRARCQGLGGDR